MLPAIPLGWRALLKKEIRQPYYRALKAFLQKEYTDGQLIFPPLKAIFKALDATSYDDVRVLLIGQDPYPTPGYAHGLSFSVEQIVRTLPLSLRNIFRELRSDIGCPVPNNGNLQSWAKQGVLMLNTVLTVRAYSPNSHQGQGWELFTDRIVQLVSEKKTRVVFVLWGCKAQKKRRLIAGAHHTVIAEAHPSPLSVKNFYGTQCFSRINQDLIDVGFPPIDWSIPDV